MPEQKKKDSTPLLLSALLVAGILLLYAGVRKHGFMCYDDPLYITENGYVQNGLSAEGLKWAFTKLAGTGTYWHPITWMSHMLDWQLFKDDAGKHHLVNVLFHAANALLLFHLLRKLTKKTGLSVVVAALFAFHPLQVDTVAWIAERKNVLSTLFWLLTLFAYVRYVELSQKKEGRAKLAYAVVFLTFALGLMCKPMLVTLPCTLLLLDFWPLNRINGSRGERIAMKDFLQLVVEKVPLFALSVISSVITLKGHEQLGMIADGQNIPLSARLANSAVAYATYLRKIVYPNDLAVFYPLPESWPTSQIAIAAVVLVAITAAALFLARRLPAILFGWLWFLGTLVPVIGILQVHDQAMADRFIYVPLIGVFIAVAWGISALVKQRSFVFCTVAAVGIAACAVASAKQIRYWKDCHSLMTHAAQVTKNNYLAYNNLGADLLKHDQPDAALENYQLAIQSKDNYPMAHSNLGVIYAQRGDFDRAMQEFQRALQFDPDYADALCNAGRVYMMQNKMETAVEHFRHAIQKRPTHVDSHNNLGNALSALGKLDEAIEEFTIASRLPPAKPDTLSNLGVALAKKGKFDEAERVLHEALALDPQHANSENNLGYIYETQQRFQEAATHYQAALRLAPNHPDAMRNLQRIMGRAQGTPVDTKN
ncbi:MAG: Tetratricopeptide 2 repeat protein [Verrucomicrobiales bacterium]|nr:Tetratricopeptide 2 repeat protein [Verrucomicrobiales bacterium]